MKISASNLPFALSTTDFKNDIKDTNVRIIPIICFKKKC